MTFINYRASAGSGKTYQLVLEYLNLALKGYRKDKFKHILAITFTNKASAEMKERIIKSLINLSMGKDSELKKKLMNKNIELTNIENRAAYVLKKILHNYSHFAITTIDSFINRLVRSFSYETDIPPGFDVEINLNRMNNFVTKSIFSSIGNDHEMTDIILKFVFSKISRDESWSVENNIIELLKEMKSEKKDTGIERIDILSPKGINRITENLEKIFTEFMKDMISLARNGMEIINSAGLSHLEFSGGKSGAAAYIKKVSNLNDFQIKKFSKMADKNFRKGSWITKKMDGKILNSISSISMELDKIQISMVKLKDQKFKNAMTCYLIYENIFLLGLISRIKRSFNEYKTEYNVVPIYDLTRNVHRIIKEGDIPFVYYILGDSFENIMIDEFQDTSRMQWDSLFPLIENSVSEGKLNLGVGDLKQSIYRWRGGETEIMGKDIHDDFHKWGLKIKNLPDNFRSKSNIVKFNNTVFNKIGEWEKFNYMLSSIYKNPIQNAKGGKGGFISLRFFQKGEEKKDILKRIEQMVNQSLAAGFSLSDIAVLTRKKKTGTEIANHLMSLKIDIVTPELLLLHKNPVAIFLINLLKYIEDNSDKTVLSEIFFFISKYFKEKIWNENWTENFFCKNKNQLPPECIKKFFNSKNLLNRLPVYEAVEELIRIFNLNNSLALPSSGYITAFLDMVSDYSTKESGGISEFLEWWKINGSDYTVPTPENSNGVKIMTIHKAKGLEFPVVILPLYDLSDKQGNNLWIYTSEFCPITSEFTPPYYVKGTSQLTNSYFAKAWEEERKRSEVDNINLFYVACTRAKDALFILAKERKKKEEKCEIYNLLFDISISEFFTDKKTNFFTKGVLKKTDPPRENNSILSVEDKQLISNRWSKVITIRERSEKFWNITPKDRQRKINRGIIIHEILSKIDNTTSFQDILKRMEYSGKVPKEERKVIEDQLKKIFEIKEVNRWFFGNGEHLTEQPIITKDGIFRPDKVIISEGVATIIDFKTGIKSQSDKSQVEKYKSLIKEMGYKSVKGMILYIGSLEIIEV